MRWAALYYPRYFDRDEYRDVDTVPAFEGAGRDLGGCLRCGIETGEDRSYCETCRDFQDEPLDMEWE